MRNFAPRPALHQDTRQRLQEKSDEIARIPAGEARQQRAGAIYEASRDTQWFERVITALRGLSGVGELCMYCSSNEPSQVEHFRPIKLFPEEAMQYENYLWTCDICNRSYKGDKFPPVNHPGEPILNPLDENVWEYFFIEDQFGRLLARVDPVTDDPLPRAASTRTVVGLDRENVQIKRSSRFTTLRSEVNTALAQVTEGTLDVATLPALLAGMRAYPFQSDVADYFLNGPGCRRDPFRRLLLAAGENIP